MKIFNRIFTKHLSAILALGLVVIVGLACNSRSDADWQSELGGKKLTFAKTSGSISDKIEIWFCPSGEYAKRTEFTGFSGGGGGTLSMADADVELGSWRVEDSTLILQSQKGEITRYDLSEGTDSDVIQLNGRGYLATGHNECGN